MIYKFNMAAPAPMIENHLNLGGASPEGEEINLNSKYITRGGKPVIPIMGEIHFQRISRRDWKKEVLKMKAGGITVVSTYMLWIYNEEREGQLDFSEDNDVHEFVKICAECGMDVVLRIGPWAHGECRNGGFPDWLLEKGIELRCDNPEYLGYVRKWYKAIADEVRDLLFVNGGNIIAIQLENELVDQAEHLNTLKKTAIEMGLKAPIYTVTGWNSVYGAEIPKYEVLPVFGGYPEAPWTGHLHKLEPSPHYFFQGMRNDSAIGADLISSVEDEETKERGIDYKLYPFATCELGGGIEVTHHRRPLIKEKDIYAISLIKLGCGNNLPGYYMYHGGTNKIGELSTLQESKATGYPNDYPIISYDFQAAIGEYGIIRGQYELLKELHLFINDFQSETAPMESYFAAENITDRNDKTTLRYAMRKGEKGGFVFVNNYQRLDMLSDKNGIKFDVDGEIFPNTALTVNDGDCFFVPFNWEIGGVLLKSSTCQPICRQGNTYFFKRNGVNPIEYVFEDKVETEADFTYGGVRFVTVTENMARYMYKLNDIVYITDGAAMYEGCVYRVGNTELSYSEWNGKEFVKHDIRADIKTADVSLEKHIHTPHDYDCELAIDGEREIRAYKIKTNAADGFICIKYAGDTAQLYSGGILIADDYYYGGEWLIPAEKLIDGEAELFISELKDDVYLETDVKERDTEVSFVPEYTYIM